MCGLLALSYFLFVLIVTLIVLSTGQELELEYQPAMTSDRQFYCSNETLLFTCTGPGTAIRWDIPSVFTARGFVAAQSPPRDTQVEGVDAILHLNQSAPLFITTLTTQGVPNITVICSTDVPATKSMTLNSSTTPPMVQNVAIAASILTGSAQGNITWTSTSGAFDLRHYRIHLCACNICMNFTSKTNFFKFKQLDLPVDIIGSHCSVSVSVSAESHCGEIGEAGKFNKIFLAIPSVNSGRHVVLGTGVAMAAAIIALFFTVL